MKKLKKLKKMKKQKKIIKYLIPLSFGLFPMLAQAYTLGGDGSFSLTTALDNLIQLLSSEIGGAVCVLSITSVGYAWLKAGRIEKGPAIATIVAISVIFSASWLANYLGWVSS